MKAARFTALLLCASFILASGCARPDVSATPAATDETVIEVSVPTYTPSPTAAPTAEPTAVPTASPSPEPTTVPTETPEPTAEPEPTPAPKPTATPEPHHAPLTNAERSMLINFEHRLPDGYVPRDLVSAKELMGSSARLKSDSIKIQYEVGVQLKRMFETAYSEGISCKYRINSAYRTMEKQWELWNKKRAADPHYGDDPYTHPVGVMPGNASEHVAGLAIDIGSTNHPDEGASFGNTPEGIWIKNNAYRFGFIIRYPADKTYITGVKNEPWHLRYVGTELAAAIYQSGLCLEEYFGEIPSNSVVNMNGTAMQPAVA